MSIDLEQSLTAEQTHARLTEAGIEKYDNQTLSNRISEGVQAAGITHAGEGGYYETYDSTTTISMALQQQLPDAQMSINLTNGIDNDITVSAPKPFSMDM